MWFLANCTLRNRWIYWRNGWFFNRKNYTILLYSHLGHRFYTQPPTGSPLLLVTTHVRFVFARFLLFYVIKRLKQCVQIGCTFRWEYLQAVSALFLVFSVVYYCFCIWWIGHTFSKRALPFSPAFFIIDSSLQSLPTALAWYCPHFPKLNMQWYLAFALT